MTTFAKFLRKTPQIKVLNFFLDNQEWDYTKMQIATEAGMSRVTLDQILPRLLKLGVIKETRRYRTSTFYKINHGNRMAKALIKFDMELSKCSSKPKEGK